MELLWKKTSFMEQLEDGIVAQSVKLCLPHDTH